MSRTRHGLLRRAALPLLLAGALALSACGGGSGAAGDGSGDPKYGGTLVAGLYLEPLALDPHRQGFWETYRVSRNLFEGLVAEDLTDTEGPTDLVPALATAWEPNEDATQWTFTLRDGVTFHDGSPFDAEALHLNVRRVSDPEYKWFDESSQARLATWFSDFTRGVVVDDHTYRFEFSKPHLGFPRGLAQSMGTLPVGNPAVWEKYGNDGFAEHPEGTGPYRFVSRKIGDRIELTRNEDYWGDRPYLDNLTFRIIPNNQTRLAALVSGEVDLISYVQPDDVDFLEDKGFQVPDGTGASLLYLTYNYENKAFADRRVRQALIQGLDREALAEEVYAGHAKALGSLVPPGNEAYDPEATDFAYDPDAARKLLAEAGYDEGELKFTIVADVANTNKAEWLQNAYKKIGVQADVVSLDRPSYAARAFGQPEPGDGFSIDEYGGSYAEWLHYAYHGNLVSKGLDPKQFPKVTSAIEKARYATDADERIELWKAADAEVRKEALAVPTVTLTKYYGLGPDVRGFTFAATNWYDLSKVWLED